ncbi:DUF3883 domain-containing protein [Myroides sp. DF42-4-2]|uniref:sacsin N-terminal ATP-binding-like domain-containing protein n=1 Tax=Myroides sp. DF42-4-2 TaxID=2746726 RepID=UPI002574A705|nr:DUF3883 domain-containing protein [Myroides sp. DF42-4-2]MDM1408695.1 DUF3883 domain-containing protein [Myroides sp. DF42-4-2]
MNEIINNNIVKSFEEQIAETEIEKKLSIPAKRLLEKLEPIPSKVDILQYRWFWELVQNASDFNDLVDVEVELNSTTLIFRHNGKPFKLVDVENLITPDSDKDDTEITAEYIGRFGSGFISTHILSSMITVEGVVQDKYLQDKHYTFKFDLDRASYLIKKELITAIGESEKQFKKFHPEVEHIPGTFETKFTYDLSKSLTPSIETKKITKEGIVYACKILPLVFTFLPKLNSVRFIDKTESKEMYFFQKERNQDKGICKIGQEINKSKKDDIIVRFVTESEVTIAVEIKDNKVVEYPEDIAVLFLYLPMIGSEKFPFPVSIHSSNFKPETERHGINISVNDTENRRCLVLGVQAYKKLLQSLANDGIRNLYNLVSLKSDRIKNLQTNAKWYQDTIEKEFKIIFDSISFVNCHGKIVSYTNLRIPFIPENKTESKDVEFYDTIFELILNKVPKREEYAKWLKNIDFTIFKTVPFRLADAVRLVDTAGSIDQLSQILKKDVAETTNWLSNFISYVVKNEIGLLTQHAIIPSKSIEGKFVNRDADIYVDSNVDTELIAVYNKMTEGDYYSKLLNDIIYKGNSTLLPSTKIKTTHSLSTEIDNIFLLRLKENSRLSKAEIEGLSLLLKWLKNKGFPNWSELSHYFPTFNGSYSNFFLESFDEEEKVKAITIRNSGKQDSLLKLAESEISSDDLQKVAESLSEINQIIKIIDKGTSISKLTQLTDLFPDDIPESVMKYAKEEARKKKEFNNLLEVGSKVEFAFIELLKDYQVEKDVVHAGGGAYDIRITNPTNGKSFYIEVKSCRYNNTDPINIAISQAKRAVKEVSNENFAIVVVERPEDNNVDPDYIKLYAKYLKNPGQYLTAIPERLEVIEEKSNTNETVDLRMDFAEFKGALDYNWIKEKTNNSSFNELIRDIQRILI